MAVLKKTFEYWTTQGERVQIRYVLHIICDPLENMLSDIQENAWYRIKYFADGREFDYEQLIENVELIKMSLLNEKISTGYCYGKSRKVSECIGKIELYFKKLPLEDKVVELTRTDHEITNGDLFTSAVEKELDEKISHRIAVSTASSKLKEKYKEHVEKDPELKEEVEGILENERIKSLAPKRE